MFSEQKHGPKRDQGSALTVCLHFWPAPSVTAQLFHFSKKAYRLVRITVLCPKSDRTDSSITNLRGLGGWFRVQSTCEFYRSLLPEPNSTIFNGLEYGPTGKTEETVSQLVVKDAN